MPKGFLAESASLPTSTTHRQPGLPKLQEFPEPSLGQFQEDDSSNDWHSIPSLSTSCAASPTSSARTSPSSASTTSNEAYMAWLCTPIIKKTLSAPKKPIPMQLWQTDDHALRCNQCDEEFSEFSAKHHCRHCGRIFCRLCSDYRRTVLGAPNQRVCKVCNDHLLSSICPDLLRLKMESSLASHTHQQNTQTRDISRTTASVLLASHTSPYELAARSAATSKAACLPPRHHQQQPPRLPVQDYINQQLKSRLSTIQHTAVNQPRSRFVVLTV